MYWWSRWISILVILAKNANNTCTSTTYHTFCTDPMNVCSSTPCTVTKCILSSSKFLFWLLFNMGVNATGTLGGSQVERRRWENRGAVGGEGSGVWGGAVPLPRKFMNFSSQNGVIWCILGVSFLRFMCPMDCSCMINFTEVPVCA